MPSFFFLDPGYRDFVPGQTPLKFSTLYRGGSFDFALVMIFSACAALLLVFCLWVLLAMGELNVLTPVMLLVSVGLLAVLRWGWREAQRYRWARRAHPLLQAHGVLLKGQLTAVNRRIVSSSRLPSQHFVDIAYTFTTPDGLVLHGQQSHQREDLRNARLPAVGTAVRVLWADDAWTVL
jgi:hypothetical protein